MWNYRRRNIALAWNWKSSCNGIIGTRLCRIHAKVVCNSNFLIDPLFLSTSWIDFEFKSKFMHQMLHAATWVAKWNTTKLATNIASKCRIIWKDLNYNACQTSLGTFAFFLLIYSSWNTFNCASSVGLWRLRVPQEHSIWILNNSDCRRTEQHCFREGVDFLFLLASEGRLVIFSAIIEGCWNDFCQALKNRILSIEWIRNVPGFLLVSMSFHLESRGPEKSHQCKLMA